MKKKLAMLFCTVLAVTSVMAACAAYPLSRFSFKLRKPISVFILTGFMEGIPKELEEAADIDGCGRYERFFKVILPLCTPGLSTLAIYNGVNIWNEFIFAFTLTQSNENRTLALALWNYQGQYSSNTAMIMACLTLSVMPMIILFIFMQDKLVKGMMAGAVKG